MVSCSANTQSNRSKRLKTTSVIYDPPPSPLDAKHHTVPWEKCEYVKEFLLKAWSQAGDSI